MNQTTAAIIPCYNHAKKIADVIAGLHQHGLPVLIVDDGSEPDCAAYLAGLAEQADIELLVLAENGGKGAAVLAGLEHLHQQGYAHAVQIDADGQHNTDDLPACLELVATHPEAIVTAKAYYDEAIPKARFFGHYLTHFWVWVNTLSLRIRDSQTGFRAYPLAITAPLIRKVYIGKRMDFDIEILVRHYWAGTDVHHFKSKVLYPEDGESHFDMLMDNWRITKMHTRLFFGMLWRSPLLLWRNIKRWMKK